MNLKGDNEFNNKIQNIHNLSTLPTQYSDSRFHNNVNNSRGNNLVNGGIINQS